MAKKYTANGVYFLLLLNLFAFNCFGESSRTTEKIQLKWAVIPQFSSTTTQKNWTPFVGYLEKVTQTKIQLLVYDDFSSYNKDLQSGVPDLAYVNPYNALQARRNQGYIPIIRDAAGKLSGILVVRKDSGIQRLDELMGADIVFPAPTAFGASLYLRALLQFQYKLKFNPVYTGSHGNSYRSVLFGRVSAGGGVIRTLEADRPQVSDNLRILYKAPSTTPHPIVVHPRVDTSLRQQLVATILEMNKNQQSRRLLLAVKITESMATSYSEYEPLELLQLDQVQQ